MFKLYRTHGEKKKKKNVAKKKAAAGKGKGKGAQKKKDALDEEPAAKKAKQSASDDEPIEIPSFPMKGGKNKAKEAPTNVKKPAAKKAKASAPKKDDIAALVNSSDPQSFIRKRISKDFDGETYFGTVMEYDDKENPPFWHVEYDDGDEEDYSKKDLIRALKHYAVKGKNDKNKS